MDNIALSQNVSNQTMEGHSLHHSDIIGIVLYVVIGVFGIIGNTLVMIVFGLLTKQKSQVNLFIFDQALIDACTSVLLILFGVINPFRPRIMAFEDDSFAGDNSTTNETMAHFIHLSASSAEFLCRFWWSRFFLFSCFDISSWNLTIMSVERYFAVFHPTTYSHYFSKRRVITMVILIWVFAPTSQYLPAIFQYTRGPWEGRECRNQQLWNKTVGAVIGFVLFLWVYVIPVCIMGYVYFKILRKLQQKKHALRSKKPLDNPSSSTGMSGTLAKRQNREARKIVHPSKNITMTLCILFGVYVVCWTPNQFTFLQFNFGGPLDFTGVWYQITVTMAFINSCVNPFIYAFRPDKFKRGMRLLLACKWEKGGNDMKLKTTFTESTSFNKLESTN